MANRKNGIERKIGIIGLGYVGKAQKFLWEWSKIYKIYEYDLHKGNQDQINSCDLAVVCVPSPMGPEGTCDTSIVESTIQWLKTPVILIKSTVIPGTTTKLKIKYKKRIVFSPEFIGENKYWSPHKFHKNPMELPFYILGGDSEDTKYVYDLLLPLLGPSKDFRFTTPETAEMAKYMCNSWGATKVTWANEIKKICEALGISFPEARELWALDPRVERIHSAVFEDKLGFSGKCFPKDLMALIATAKNAGYEPELLKEVLKSNDRFKQGA